MFLKIAWRNLWRSKRRTIITMASVFFAVMLSVLMRSAQEGSYDLQVENVVGFYTGYIQIHQQGYWDDRILDNSFPENDTLNRTLEENPLVTSFTPRLESFALASSGKNTKGTMVVGIDPEQENHVTKLKDKVVEGEYLSGTNEDAILVAEGLAKQLNLKTNDTIVLIGQGYHGVSAAGKYPIKGLLKFGAPDLNNSLVYLPIEKARWLYGAEGLLTSIAIMIDKPSNAELVAAELKETLDLNRYEVMDWKELIPELIEYIESDRAGGIIMVIILYMVIAFGIFGTLLMMVNERKHEFGILIAIGMKNYKLSIIVFIETIFIAILGVISGAIGSIPIVYYFNQNPIKITGDVAQVYEDFGFEPIMPFSSDPSLFMEQAYTVLILASVLALHPVIKIIRMNAIKAMRS